MNVFDKNLLFEMSYALMRRFAFIEVPSPHETVFRELIDTWADGDSAAAETAKSLMALRDLKDIGPAAFRDITTFASKRREASPVAEGALRLQLFYSYLLPQFEGLDEVEGKALFKAVVRLVGAENRDAVYQMLTGVLGLTGLRRSSAALDEPASSDAESSPSETDSESEAPA